METEPKVLFDMKNDDGTYSQMLYFDPKYATFTGARKSLKQQGLVLPTFKQMTTILGLFSEPRVFFMSQFLKKHPSTKEDTFTHIEKARKMFFETKFMTNTALYFVKNKGVYIIDNPEVRENTVILEAGDLERRLKDGDPSVRFVSHGFGIESLGLKESEIDSDYNHNLRSFNRYFKGDTRIKIGDLKKIPVLRALASKKGVLDIVSFAGVYHWHKRVNQMIVPDWRFREKEDTYTQIATLEEIYTGPCFGRELVVKGSPLQVNLCSYTKDGAKTYAEQPNTFQYAFAIKN